MEIAGPGFLNLRLKPAAKQQTVREVLNVGKQYGMLPASGQKLMVEFVSANPTGPLHVGHGRQAALGDAITDPAVRAQLDQVFDARAAELKAQA